MNHLFLDIETIPAPEKELDKLKFLYDRLKRKYSKRPDAPEMKLTFADYHKNTCFDGAFGQIICIAYAFNSDPTQVICHPQDEAATIADFWKIALKADCFVGYNLIDFDLRFIWQRSVKFGIKPPRDLSLLKPQSSPIFDVAKEWTKWVSLKDPGLEYLALALGIESPKTHLDGSGVWDAFKKGEIDKICHYCQADVETTRRTFQKLTFSS